MDITTICKIIICIGILQTCSLYHVGAVDRIHFKVPEMVEWSAAEAACRKNNGTLFKPNETSFDVSLFSESNFNDDLWVGAKCINITNVGSASRGDSFFRCEMCKAEGSCGTTCLYKACGDRCKVLCVALRGIDDYHKGALELDKTSWTFQHPLQPSPAYDGLVVYTVCSGVSVTIDIMEEPYNHVLSDTPSNWTEANHWCSKYLTKLGDKIQNTSFSTPIGYCHTGCFWTRNVIQVQLQTAIAHENEPGECGILHNGTISFTSCKRYLHPLCERVANIALETPRHYFSEGHISSILMNNTITSMTTTQASQRRTNRINETITMSSIYATLSVANDITRWTTIGLNVEHSSSLVRVGATISSNDLEESPQKSDTGIIIGAVIGSVVFFMLTVLGIICVRRKLLQRTISSKHESKNMKMHKTDTIHKPINHYQCQDVPLETGSGPELFAQSESKCEGFCSGNVTQMSKSGKSAYTIDPEVSNVTYATVTKKVNVNSINLTYKTNYDSYDHLNGIHESRDDSVAENVYDTTNFEQRNDCGSTSDSIYDISGGHGKNRDEGVGLYDRVNTTISNEYDTTEDLRTNCNAAYDHI